MNFAVKSSFTAKRRREKRIQSTQKKREYKTMIENSRVKALTLFLRQTICWQVHSQSLAIGVNIVHVESKKARTVQKYYAQQILHLEEWSSLLLLVCYTTRTRQKFPLSQVSPSLVSEKKILLCFCWQSSIDEKEDPLLIWFMVTSYVQPVSHQS